jgi:hypothetical protein
MRWAAEIVCMKLSREIKLIRLYDCFLWEKYQSERVVAFSNVKQADDIHFTDEAIIFFVGRVYMMVAVVRVSSRVVFGRKGVVQILY